VTRKKADPVKLNLKCLKDASNRRNVALIQSYNAQEAGFVSDGQPVFEAIEATIADTDDKGKMPLWEGYQTIENYGRSVGKTAKRQMSQVRTGRAVCEFYAWLAARKKPEVVLEFGAAFGASGMYWLAGLEKARNGILYSFELNAIWCDIARGNFRSVSDRFCLTEGTFEDNRHQIPVNVGIALIDAIHTKEFVLEQFELVRSVAAPGAIVVFDDINFSADMADCWAEVCDFPDLAAIWQIGKRVGLVELP